MLEEVHEDIRVALPSQELVTIYSITDRQRENGHDEYQITCNSIRDKCGRCRWLL